MNNRRDAAIAMSHMANWSVITAGWLELTAQSNLDIDVTRRDISDMDLENMLSKMGSGVKQFANRYAEYDAPVQDPHLLYAYEPAAPAHEANSKYSYGGGSKNGAAMSALTLLAFLFFLHILQQCIKDHMMAMSSPQITIMTAGRESEDELKQNAKLDKTGFTGVNENVPANIGNSDVDVVKSDENKYLMKINTAEPPKSGAKNYAFPKDFNERSFAQSGFVSAMDNDSNM